MSVNSKTGQPNIYPRQNKEIATKAEQDDILPGHKLPKKMKQMTQERLEAIESKRGPFYLRQSTSLKQKTEEFFKKQKRKNVWKNRGNAGLPNKTLPRALKKSIIVIPLAEAKKKD